MLILQKTNRLLTTSITHIIIIKKRISWKENKSQSKSKSKNMELMYSRLMKTIKIPTKAKISFRALFKRIRKIKKIYQKYKQLLAHCNI